MGSTIYLETVSRSKWNSSALRARLPDVLSHVLSGQSQPVESQGAEVDHFPSLCGWGYFQLASGFPVFYPHVNHRREWYLITCHRISNLTSEFPNIVENGSSFF